MWQPCELLYTCNLLLLLTYLLKSKDSKYRALYTAAVSCQLAANLRRPGGWRKSGVVVAHRSDLLTPSSRHLCGSGAISSCHLYAIGRRPPRRGALTYTSDADLTAARPVAGTPAHRRMLLAGDVINDPATAAAAAAAAVDGVRTKSSQSTSCKCDRLARNS